MADTKLRQSLHEAYKNAEIKLYKQLRQALDRAHTRQSLNAA
jgi:hypothetical protein